MRALSVVFVWLVSTAVAAGAAAQPSDDATISGGTENGLYTVTLAPVPEEIPVGKRHAWTVSIDDKEGRAVQPEQLAFYGGMRAHGHGLPSTPRVTREIEPGTYLVEGVLFNMHGDWELVIGVVGPAGPDKVLFDLSLAPSEDKDEQVAGWSPQELALMRSLMLPADLVAARDPSNRLAGNAAAVSVGEALFFDKGLSLKGDISCASCHDPRLHFTDGRRVSVGSRELRRNSPTLLGAAQGDWFYWDGRRDTVWAQALSPIETPGEMDNNRLRVVRYVMTHPAYKSDFAMLVGDLPDLDALPESAGPYGAAEDKSRWNSLSESERRKINAAFAAVGKMLGAYVATLEPRPSRFDAYAAALADDAELDELLTTEERRGLRLFLSPEKTQCLRCHNGPYFTNFGFNNIGTGVPEEGGLPDFGRMIGLQAALVDEFNCVGRYSDADSDSCGHHRFAAQGHADNGAFKVPTLRNVAQTGPYMHDGRFDGLIEVLGFYRDPPPKEISNHELPPLALTDDELRDLAAFLGALTSVPNR